VTVEEVNDAFRKAAAIPPLKGVMGVLEDEWASSRIVGDPHSSIVDLPLTAVQEELLSVAAWYDNEMGYATAWPRPQPRSRYELFIRWNLHAETFDVCAHTACSSPASTETGRQLDALRGATRRT